MLKAVQDILQFTQPLLLRALMVWVTSHLTNNPEPGYKGVLIAVGMFVTAFSQTMFLHQYFQICNITGMRMRAALVTAIYRKTIVLSNSSRQQSTVGEVCIKTYSLVNILMDMPECIDRKQNECGCSAFNGLVHVFSYWVERALSDMYCALFVISDNGT